MTTPRAGELPGTMRISVLSEPGRLELQERPVPPPGPQEVLVAVRSVGICGSDAHYFQHGRIADFVVRGPLVLGHESCGRIVAVGDGVDRGRLGARVAIEPGTACRACVQCKAGRYNLCQKMKFFATPPVDGALAEYVLVPADLAFDLPDEVSDDAGALLEPLSVAIWATGKAAITAGDSVLIAEGRPDWPYRNAGSASARCHHYRRHRHRTGPARRGQPQRCDCDAGRSRGARRRPGLRCVPGLLRDTVSDHRRDPFAPPRWASRARRHRAGRADDSLRAAAAARADYHRDIPLRQHLAGRHLARRHRSC